MATILSLPIPVLQDIFENLELSDKKNLRSTCSQINAVVESQVFAKLAITGATWRKTLALLENMAFSRNSIAYHVLDVQIGPFPEIQEAKKRRRAAATLEKCLVPAICSLKRLRAVRWSFAEVSCNLTTTRAISAALSSLEHLRDFSLYIEHCDSLRFFDLQHLGPFQNIFISAPASLMDVLCGPIRNLLAKSPELQSLTLRYYCNWDTTQPLLSDIVADLPPLPLRTLQFDGVMIGKPKALLPHLRSLSSLRIAWYLHPAHVSGLWTLLRTERIHLKELEIAFLDNDSLDYLCSYTGLEKLSFILHVIDSMEDSLSHRFFMEALSKHADTLLELTIDNHSTWGLGSWSANEVNARRLCQCKKLERLTLTMGDHEYDYTATLLNAIAITKPSLTDLHLKSCPRRVYTTFAPPCEMAILDFGPVSSATFNSSFQIRHNNQIFCPSQDEAGYKFRLRDYPRPCIFRTPEVFSLADLHYSFWSRICDSTESGWSALRRVTQMVSKRR